MKTRISKSEVMSKAWEIIKNDIKRNKVLGLPRYYPTFSDALKSAWKVVKVTTAKMEEYRIINERKKTTVYKVATYSEVMQDSLINEYTGSAYNGD